MTDTAAEAVTTTEAAQPGQNAPKKSKGNKGTSSSDGAPDANRGSNKAKPKKKANAAAQKPTAKKQPKAKKAPKPAAEAREGSKKAIILDLLRRPKGATLGENLKATKWQAHSVRGFIAGPIKRAGLVVESTKSESSERTYRIAK
jgi:FtsZ-interacting cell division protein ZipA